MIGYMLQSVFALPDRHDIIKGAEVPLLYNNLKEGGKRNEDKEGSRWSNGSGAFFTDT